MIAQEFGELFGGEGGVQGEVTLEIESALGNGTRVVGMPMVGETAWDLRNV